MTAPADGKAASHGGRFVKGQSGNPKGRPRKVTQPRVKANTSAFDIILDRTVPVGQGGVRRELTLDEALMLKTYQEALAGGQRARRVILKQIRKRDEMRAKLAPPASSTHPPIEIRAMPVPSRNADEALVLLGIASVDAERVARVATYTTGEDDPSQGHPPLLLEPWAVQAALSRRRSGTALSGQEIAVITHCTRDAESLRWPAGSRT